MEAVRLHFSIRANKHFEKDKQKILRNAGVSTPYFHNGYFSTLKTIVDFKNTRDVQNWPAPEVADNINSTDIGDLGHTNGEIDEIIFEEGMIMRKLFFLGLILALFMSLSGTAMGFTVTIYTDKTEWENALAGLYLTEDFNDLLLNAEISYVSSESGHINVNFGYYQDVLMSGSENEPMTIWTFTPQIIAYGGTWTLAGPGGSGNSLLIYIDDIDQPVGIISNDYDGDFWGFISDTPFISVSILGGNGSNQQSYKLDDMVYCLY